MTFQCGVILNFDRAKATWWPSGCACGTRDLSKHWENATFHYFSIILSIVVGWHPDAYEQVSIALQIVRQLRRVKYIHAHCRLPTCGYLAGHWDLNSHNLAITHAFPCLSDTNLDDEEATKVECSIYNKVYNKHLSLLGWYRSVPCLPRALPTLKDCESQLDYQACLSSIMIFIQASVRCF